MEEVNFSLSMHLRETALARNVSDFTLNSFLSLATNITHKSTVQSLRVRICSNCDENRCEFICFTSVLISKDDEMISKYIENSFGFERKKVRRMLTISVSAELCWCWCCCKLAERGFEKEDTCEQDERNSVNLMRMPLNICQKVFSIAHSSKNRTNTYQ